MSKTPKIVRTGSSQAERLPEAYCFTVDEVVISREGDAVGLQPENCSGDRWKSVRSAIRRGVTADFLADQADQLLEKPNPALDALFR